MIAFSKEICVFCHPDCKMQLLTFLTLNCFTFPTNSVFVFLFFPPTQYLFDFVFLCYKYPFVFFNVYFPLLKIYRNI